MKRPLDIKLFRTTRPPVAAIVDRLLDSRELAGLAARGAGLVELRCDLLNLSTDEIVSYAATVKTDSALPLLVTLRETLANKTDRTAIFGRLVEIADIIDIEIDTPIRDAVIALAKKAGCLVIVSEHDYNKMPDDSRLLSIVRDSFAAGADIAKIAAHAASREDAARLMKFAGSRNEEIIAIAMGSAGTVTRATAPLFGSLFTYAYIGSEAVAPGQISLDEMGIILPLLFPEIK